MNDVSKERVPSVQRGIIRMSQGIIFNFYLNSDFPMAHLPFVMQ